MDKKAEKIIDAAKELLKLYGYFVDSLWHVDDINIICEQHGIPLLEAGEAMKVFAIAKEQFDGENGISWPKLEKALYTYLQRKAVVAMQQKEPT